MPDALLQRGLMAWAALFGNVSSHILPWADSRSSAAIGERRVPGRENERFRGDRRE
jgi:hypothetical protein